MSITSITAAAMLGSINISVWEARKQDKKTAEEVAVSKGARSKRAATVHKHLFSECPALESIKSLRGEVRQWFNTTTLPWDDNGRRIVTTAQYLDITAQAAKYEQQFNALVRAFLATYSTEISKQAFEMGALFDRNEYPHEDEVAAKFRFSYVVEPLPMSGDFRVDIGNEAKNQLAEQYERQIAERVSGAVADAWERVKTQVEWVRERMDAVLAYDPDAVEENKTLDDDGNVVSVEIKKKRRPKLYDSMLEQGLALTNLLKDLNITNDPRLEEARRDLESALSRVDIDSLRESPELQRSTQAAMQDILDKFAL
jgi:hypothetical protein